MTIALALITQLLLVLLVVTAAVLGTALGYFYVRAKRSESSDLTPVEKAELKQRDKELSAIRLRIEEIYERQQVGADTQQAIIQQQFEQLNNELRSRSRQIEGLQGQLRHEIEARRSEMDQLRGQLEEAVQHVMRPQLQPPKQDHGDQPAATPAPAQELSVAQRSVHAEFDETFEPEEAKPARMPLLYDDFDDDEFPIELVDEEDRDSIDFSWEPVDLNLTAEEESFLPGSDLVSLFDDPEDEIVAMESGAFGAAAPEPDNDAFYVEDNTVFAGGTSPEASVKESAPLDKQTTDRPSFEPLDEDDSFTVEFASPKPDGPPASIPPITSEPFSSGPYFSSGDGLNTHDERHAEEATVEPDPPSGADDLTVIPMIDEERQRTLYRLGIITLTDVAHLNRSDADRIANAIRGVSGEEVATDWVFAAQSVLFARYQAEMSRPRSQAA